LLKAFDATIGVAPPYVNPLQVKKSTAWSAADISSVQGILETAPASSARLTAQTEIDHWPIALQALVLTLIDQLNVLRARVSPPLAAITPAQALAAIRDKAATL
jgi:hypothetical protein